MEDILITRTNRGILIDITDRNGIERMILESGNLNTIISSVMDAIDDHKDQAIRSFESNDGLEAQRHTDWVNTLMYVLRVVSKI